MFLRVPCGKTRVLEQMKNPHIQQSSPSLAQWGKWANERLRGIEIFCAKGANTRPKAQQGWIPCEHFERSRCAFGAKKIVLDESLVCPKDGGERRIAKPPVMALNRCGHPLPSPLPPAGKGKENLKTLSPRHFLLLSC